MAIVLGLASALIYGAADFTGGLETRRSGPLTVVLWSQLVGLAALLAVVALQQVAVPGGDDLGWGALAGLGGGSGVVLLYRALSLGQMSVVAPVTAVGAAAGPVLFGLLIGERPGALALVGVAVALTAIVLVSAVPDPRPPAEARAGDAPAGSALVAAGRRSGRQRPGLLEAVLAGLAFAAFFILLDRTSSASGLWPLLTARTSILVAGLAALVTGTSLRPLPGALPRIGLVGALDMGANLLYLLATRQGLLSVVAVLVSLYPVSTVVLARMVLGERLAAPQLVGLGTAAAGVALMAAG